MRRVGGHRRGVLGVAALVALAVVAALGLGLAKTQRDARRTVEQRFSYGSATAAALVQTIVGQAYTSDAQLAQRALAAPTISKQRIDRVAPRIGQGSFIVLDSSGHKIAAKPANAEVRSAADAHIRQALAGKPAISGTLGSGNASIIELAVPYPAKGGRRVLVVPTTSSAVQQVLKPYLANLPGVAGHRAYIFGPRGEELADAVPKGGNDRSLLSALRGAQGTTSANYDGGQRRFSSSPIGGTSWELVDTARASVVYSPVHGWPRALPWLVLLLLLPAALFIVMLADRASRAAQRARQASEAKSAFLASMSHELRTPMTTVIGFSQMLHEGRLGELTERQHEVVGHIHTSSKHLNQLIAEVLDLSRVEEGRMTFHPEDAEPHLLVGEVAEGMGGLAEDRGIEIAIDAPDIGTFRLDPSRFKQVLYNLIGNAIKFSQAGGKVVVTLRREEPGELSVVVSDNGTGIRAEDLDKIFLPFEQGSHRNGGAGLGLAVSRRIVDAQGGRIGVLSEPGAGATFTVTLPPSR